MRTDDEKLWALLAHLSVFFCSMIGPAIIWIVKKDSPFVAYHALQALIYQVVMMVFVFVIVVPISFCTFGIGGILGFVPALGGILVGVQAYGGSWKGYPGLAGIALPPEGRLELGV